jgi:predicted TIM-barrel fold metal-dependent hydrolase
LPQNPQFDTMTVDTHFHAFLARQAQAGARYQPTFDAHLADWRAQALSCGVTHGVLVQTSFMGTDNAHLLAQLATDPAHLRGIAVVSPNATVEELTGLHALGVRGLRINLGGSPHDMTPWAQATALWDAVLALGWHVELHTDTGALPAVLAVLPASLPLVLDHFGKPEAASTLDATVQAIARRVNRPVSRAGAKPWVYVKLSAPYRLHHALQSKQALRALAQVWLAMLGPNALLWGSDWPCTNHEKFAHYPALHAQLADWLDHDAALLALVRQHNPRALYWS